MTLWLDVFTNGNYRLDRVINANALGNFFLSESHIMSHKKMTI